VLEDQARRNDICWSVCLPIDVPPALTSVPAYSRGGALADRAASRSPGATAYYNQLRDRKIGHEAALRQLANRLVASCMGA